MTHDEFLTRSSEFQNTPISRYLNVLVAPDNIAVLLIIEVRGKAFKVTLASRSNLYRGERDFWVPISAFAVAAGNEEEMLGILQFKPWFKGLMIDQMKINLGIKF